MKRACFACLLLCLTTLLLSQSNPDPRINKSAKVVPPISAPKDENVRRLVNAVTTDVMTSKPERVQ